MILSVCCGCDGYIHDRSLMQIQGRFYHVSCVVCSVCGRNLSDKCYAHDDDDGGGEENDDDDDVDDGDDDDGNSRDESNHAEEKKNEREKDFFTVCKTCGVEDGEKIDGGREEHDGDGDDDDVGGAIGDGGGVIGGDVVDGDVVGGENKVNKDDNGDGRKKSVSSDQNNNLSETFKKLPSAFEIALKNFDTTTHLLSEVFENPQNDDHRNDVMRETKETLENAKNKNKVRRKISKLKLFCSQDLCRFRLNYYLENINIFFKLMFLLKL